MSRTLSLFTAVFLALGALSVAAPVDSNSLASPIEQTVSNITLEKRKKHHKKSKKNTTKKKTTKKASKKTTTKKTTTTKKSATATGSSSGSFSGTGTWFLPATEGGSQGACGPEEGNNSLIVALNSPQYGSMNKKSSWCGKKIKITGPKGSVTATVNDACPECKHGDLDLTPVLFKQVIGDMNIGVGKITWYEL